MIDKEKYRLHKEDTGSTAIQIIGLREKIQKIVAHWQRNRKINRDEKRKKERWKDVPARRALLEKLAKEKRFFQYLKKNNPEIYEKLKKELK
ncbi:MAG: 30S ribosomal protein S15 [Candidatus Moeniiplasma glomeromycotorum]|nr:30S ribosomal protein S15 [Candidatus Moeniiplasma glomeromycotorum]